MCVITCNKYSDKPNHSGWSYMDYRQDEKPIEKMGTIFIGNVSTFYEMNTKKSFMYDEENHKWWDM